MNKPRGAVARSAQQRPLVSGTGLLFVGLILVAGGCEPGTTPTEQPPTEHNVSISSLPALGGTTTGGGGAIKGASVTVTAIPNSGYMFRRWSEGGLPLTTNSSFSFAVDRDRTLVAEFDQTVDVLLDPAPTNGGLVEGAGEYALGTSVTLAASANAGYMFEAWIENGTVVSDQTGFALVLDRDRRLEARFGVRRDAGRWTPGGTYSDWVFPEGVYESLEWTFVAVADPPASLAADGLLHYYAYNFAVENATSTVGGGYAGFQTHHIWDGGKFINFSIWGSNGGKSNDFVNPRNSESGGYQIAYWYDWTEGYSYRFQLTEGPSGVDVMGKWWGLWVTEVETDITTFVGEQRIPPRADNAPNHLMINRTSMFAEDLHWWRALYGYVPYICSEFQPSSMAAVDISANDGSVRPVGFSSFTNSGDEIVATNGYQTEACHVTMYTNDDFEVQHNPGFWPEPPPRVIR